MILQANLRTFEGPGFEDLQVTRCRKYSTFSTFGDETFVQRNMRSTWSLLNDPHSSELAKVNRFQDPQHEYIIFVLLILSKIYTFPVESRSKIDLV